ncbi:MAG: DUF362 domain-containing protein [Candidatus Eisenbacteria bacterium]|uniref:DUF362 domain-containing protein n=1 Tax=Eiseniibacteriota bacterium TaxID=2212470 RepID=A0A948RX36_UNCEI|nr:DUF362 domain-containing protein [Candidatus Eisenbacteria bacterium]MBU1948874.1 DUF362 domain-containing protein [Candidatus Eisenbacteria bacterium]MBU2691561.1 DUF362 domain-containing protein [Candidatus Eisenbacteria bacterium]
MAQTRRDFLKKAAIVGGALAVHPMDAWAAETLSADMSIARWSGADLSDEGVPAMAAALTKQAIEAIGGMGRFVSKGDKVWIKPNMGWNRAPELAATTNPDVVGALTRLCLEAGAKEVKVGDNTCHKSTQCYRSSGIEKAVEAAGGKTVYLDENRFREVNLNGKRLDKWALYSEILSSDLVINVPIVKHHGLSRATLCMKNYMGIVGGQRNAWHQDIPTCLCDITAYMKPRLCVLDAVRILTAHGPQGGNLEDVKRVNTVAAGIDIIALDAFGAELLGHKPDQIEAVKAGFEAGLGQIDYHKVALKELSVS